MMSWKMLWIMTRMVKWMMTSLATSGTDVLWQRLVAMFGDDIWFATSAGKMVVMPTTTTTMMTVMMMMRLLLLMMMIMMM